MLTVAVVDDQVRFRSALATVVEMTEGLELGPSLASVAELRQLVQSDPALFARLDVVLMDLDMPGESGLEGVKLIKSTRPDVQVVMCTVYDDDAAVRSAIELGADGYLLKSAPLDELLGRLQDVHRGGAPLDPAVARGLLQSLRSEPTPEPAAAWQVASDGSEVLTPEGRLDLRRRRAVRRILARLARARMEAPGSVVTVEECMEAGWPGERMAWGSAQARVWTAIRTLRSLGLQEVLETVSEGYRLAGVVRVVVR